MNEPLNLTNKDCIANLAIEFKDVAKKHPMFMQFLEYYCGYNTPILSSDPNEISYSSGKRDVILTIKTIMRDDILPEQIAKFYERNL